MSILYSIDIALNVPYVEENIKYALTEGMKKGFIYFNEELQGFLAIDEAVRRILYIDYESGERHIITKFQDTMFFIWFFKSDNDLLIFSIGSFGYRWDRDFSNGFRKYTIDFARYIRLMLQVCEDIALLELVTFSDELDDIFYENKNCVMVALDMGDFGRSDAAGFDGGKLSVKFLLCNAVQNGITFFDEQLESLVEPSAQQYYEILKAGFPAYLYAKKDEVLFKIEIKRMGHGCEFVSVYPLEPYRMKKGYGSGEEKIDVAFYVQRLLELCENFAIYELKTFI